MSIESEILRIQHNVADTYAAVAGKGGTVPTQPTSANLAAAVASIPTGGSSGEIYSTEEQVIGTWIDGKPLYRRLFHAIIPPISVDWQTLNEITDDIVGVMLNAYAINRSNFGIEPLPTTAGNGVDSAPTKVMFVPGVGMQIYNRGSWYVGRLCRSVLYYTKTTDQATIELPTALTVNKADTAMNMTDISAAEILGSEMNYAVAATAALGDGLENEEVQV